jgi:hypothetical protein
MAFYYSSKLKIENKGDPAIWFSAVYFLLLQFKE